MTNFNLKLKKNLLKYFEKIFASFSDLLVYIFIYEVSCIFQLLWQTLKLKWKGTQENILKMYCFLSACNTYNIEFCLNMYDILIWLIFIEHHITDYIREWLI